MPTRRALLTLIAAAAASACSAPPAAALGSLVDMQIVDRSRGETLSTWRHRGASYVAGRPGDRYAVRLTNRSPGRVLVVLSVDGVNAVSGDTAAPGQAGYVLAPWQTTEITGWRKSLSEAAAFYFTALPDSYAARTSRPDNVGVIGVAVFRERERALVAPPALDGGAMPQREMNRDRGAAAQEAAPAPSAKAAARDERLGTGHGEREFAPVTQTQFERASERPAELTLLRYDSRENLLASGVIRLLAPRRAPEPFPGFVPDPPG